MKLRRSLAAAAVTAVIAPAALLAAPSAFATETPGSSETTASTETPGAGETTATTPEETPGTGETSTEEETPGTGETSAAEETPGTGETSTEEETPGTATPGATESTTTSPSPSPTESLTEGCEDAAFNASISGLPGKIVAGSGWKQFNLNLDNSKGKKAEDVLLGAVLLYKKDAHGDFTSSLASKYAQIQYFDGEKWTSELSAGGEIGGFITVEAGEKISLKLRLSIKSTAPAGSAVGIAFGVYTDEKGENCFADESWYSFEVLAAGSKPPTGDNDNKPQEGKPPVKVKPAADEVEDLTGNLAETGSDSQLPVIGLIGGITVVAGAGVVFAVKRRRTVGAEA
ncbi:LPXTG cell wall anchor domain-containing protein [Streptomyces sp. YC504]|uniref:LPXTG cell wall anchor domain-containing protein n=1 Tax=Streptomyces mesophilus TaxID=1775132 RepID=A0A6G4XE74_9ACTN|nr:LAETG motif-containing sortase-dependent surface protein [Streptomyces mesophilus]NGO75839.1 LPXTG cell wall anchor domain-containing protein [Streptomyces mesophilus]